MKNHKHLSVYNKHAGGRVGQDERSRSWSHDYEVGRSHGQVFCNIFDESFMNKDKLIMNKDLLMNLTLLRDKEELATIESIDSGAVYTLALKTHVGMSIATWRYFAGW